MPLSQFRRARSYQPVWAAVAVLALVQTAYAAAFIWRSSFEVEGRRYFCLFDDAMISMRYADNWARGLGWVWNAGERVEGYTNFGWTVLLGLIHLLNLPPEQTCLIVQILGIPVLWGALVATALLARACRLLPIIAIGALALTAGLYNLHYFTLLGMETGLLTVLVTLSLASAARALGNGERAMARAMQAMLWLAPALLLRSDALILALFIAGYLLVFVRPRGRLGVVTGFACVVLVAAGHTAWRYSYYGEMTPNTYYLKLTGWPIERRLEAGLRHSFWTAAQYGLPVLMAAGAFLRPRRWHFLISGAFTVSVAYQVYCGGDAWPLNRFVLPVAPALFVLAAEGALRLTRSLVSHPRTALRLTLGSVLACLLAIHAVYWDRWLLIQPPDMTRDNRMNLQYHVGLERIARPEATVAVGYAGALPYYSRRHCIDLYGKCEPYIARLPVTAGNRPGHNKMDLVYVMTHYEPDIILHSAFPTDRPPGNAYVPAALPVDGTELLLYRRRASRHVLGGGELTEDEAFRFWERATGAPPPR